MLEGWHHHPLFVHERTKLEYVSGMVLIPVPFLPTLLTMAQSADGSWYGTGRTFVY